MKKARGYCSPCPWPPTARPSAFLYGRRKFATTFCAAANCLRSSSTTITWIAASTFCSRSWPADFEGERISARGRSQPVIFVSRRGVLLMDFRPLNDLERRQLVNALRGNAESDRAILLNRRDTSFLGAAEEVPEEEVINAIRSVPCHY